jgi:pimeloyl-ACP methyl ester carboxylesterase
MRRLVSATAVLLVTAALVGAPQLTTPAVADSTPVMPGASGDRTLSIGGTSDGATQAKRAASAHLAAGSGAPHSKGNSAAGSGVAGANAAENGVYPVGNGVVDAQVLATAAFGPGWDSAQYITTPPAYGTNAQIDNLGGFGSDGSSALLTTGNAAWAGEPNLFQSSSRDSGGGIVRGDNTYDVTILKITFSVPAGVNCLSLNFRFYSEEVPEFTTRGYNDAFVAELDRNTWDTTGTTVTAPDNFARDSNGKLVSANNSGALAMSDRMAAGTTYDAATPVMVAQTPITAGSHSLYLSIFDQFDAVYDSAVAVDNVKLDNRSGCTTGIPDIPLPVIFVPGITGTYLNTAGGDEAWPRAVQTFLSRSDSHLDQLQLKDDGDTNCDGCTIRPGRVILSVGVPHVYTQDAYQPTVDFFVKAGFHYDEDGVPQSGENFFMFGYDWRRSAEHNASELLDFIDTVLAATGAPKVNILAHSQGGLVAEAAVNRARIVGKVNRLVTLGTPYLGAGVVVGLLHYQTPCLNDIPVVKWCALNPEEVQRLAKNMTGMLQLLPSDEYFNKVGSPVNIKYDADGNGSVDGYLSIPQYLNLYNDTAVYNRPLIEQAEQWHRGYDAWHQADADMGFQRIYSTGYWTIWAIDVDQVQVCNVLNGAPHCHTEVQGKAHNDEGDGKVPVGSAYLDPGHDVKVDGLEHQALAQSGRSLGMALATLRGNGAIKYDSQTLASIAAAGGHVAQAGEPAPTLSGTELTASGPVWGYLTDQDGWRNGVIEPSTGNSVADIPGSSFAPTTGGGVHSLTESGTTQGRWVATGPGEFSLVINAYANGVITRTVAFPRVGVVAGTVVKLSAIVTPVVSVPALDVDDNGDGTIDRTVPAMPAVTGTAATDAVRPTSTAVVAPSGSGRVSVALSATDDSGGSGVDHIEWWYAAGNQSGVYSGTPLDLPASGSLVFRATDRAGNVEWIKTVNLA